MATGGVRLDIRAILGSGRDAGPTMREIHEMRRERDRRFRTPGADRKIFTVQQMLDRITATDPHLVDRARDLMAARLEHTTTVSGYLVDQVHWSSDPPDLETGEVLLRLEASCVPRTDGEWPSIHAAIAEDEADRAAAKRERSMDPVHGPLDALRRSADWWADPDLRGL